MEFYKFKLLIIRSFGLSLIRNYATMWSTNWKYPSD